MDTPVNDNNSVRIPIPSWKYALPYGVCMGMLYITTLSVMSDWGFGDSINHTQPIGGFLAIGFISAVAWRWPYFMSACAAGLLVSIFMLPQSIEIPMSWTGLALIVVSFLFPLLIFVLPRLLERP